MNKPERHPNHVLSTTSRKFLEKCLPDEWIFNIPDHDYGLDYHIEIVQEGQVTGLNFSIQLKSTARSSGFENAKSTLKLSTLRYFSVRLEPIMVVQYEADSQEAYWTWVDSHAIDLTQPSKTYTFSIHKSRKLSEINWIEIASHVQMSFNRKSMISDFDISKLHDDFEIAAWNAYYKRDFTQAIYLFEEVRKAMQLTRQARQALIWSLYSSYRYHDALNQVNSLLLEWQSSSIYQVKACILAELGFSEGDEGRILLAKNLFLEYLEPDSPAEMFYNYANTLNGLGKYDAAIENFKISLSKDPNRAECWKNLGSAYYSIGDHLEELVCYDKALSLNPELPEALFSKAITLTRIFHNYDAAIELFEKVISPERAIQRNMVSGLFWLAFSYEKVHCIDKALFWLDRGLEFDSRNQYLLHLKFDLLTRNFKLDDRLKKITEGFLLYGIDLDGDPKYIKALIEFRQLSFDDALQLLNRHNNTFQNVSRKDLDAVLFSFDDVVNSLDYNRIYLEFRAEYPLNRYIDHIISPFLSIEASFWDILDVTFCFAFNRALQRFGEANDELQLGRTVFSIVVERTPRVIPLLMPFENCSGDEVQEIFAIIYSGLTTIAFREIGIQSGYLSKILNLRKVDPSEFFSDSGIKSLEESTYEKLTIELRAGFGG